MRLSKSSDAKMPLEHKSSSAKVKALQKLLGNEEQKNVVAEIPAQPNFDQQPLFSQFASNFDKRRL